MKNQKEKDTRQHWTDPGTVQKGDYVVVRGKNCDFGAVALVGEMPSGKVLIRNENGIQHDVFADDLVDRWSGGAIAAGVKAHGNDPELLHNNRRNQ